MVQQAVNKLLKENIYKLVSPKYDTNYYTVTRIPNQDQKNQIC